jgi:hypothetical protein
MVKIFLVKILTINLLPWDDRGMALGELDQYNTFPRTRGQQKDFTNVQETKEWYQSGLGPIIHMHSVMRSSQISSGAPSRPGESTQTP